MKGSLRSIGYLFFLSFACTLCIAQTNHQTLTEQLQKSLNHAITESDLTPGAVLLVSSPKIGTLIVAAGVQNNKTSAPMRTNNNFRIASISKTFLAVVVLKLVEQGKLQLDDKISTLLPKSMEIDRIPNGNKLTIRELLQMRSGIPNYTDYDSYTEKVEAEPNLKWTPKDGVQLIYDEKPNFAPDKSYEYSNTNYLLLQSIVETITKTSLAVQFRKDIFTPLQMDHTYLELHERQPEGFNGLKTHGYELDDNKLIDVTTINDGLGLADGGCVSTAQDLAKFVQALLQNKILISADYLKQMLNGKGPEKYGLGIYQEKVNGEWALTHNGSSSGFAGQYYYFPDRQLTIILLTNSYDSDIIEDEVAEVLTLIDNQSKGS